MTGMAAAWLLLPRDVPGEAGNSHYVAEHPIPSRKIPRLGTESKRHSTRQFRKPARKEYDLSTLHRVFKDLGSYILYTALNLIKNHRHLLFKH